MATFTTPMAAGSNLTADRINAMVGVMTPYTPVVTNTGGAAFSTLTGFFVRVGPIVFVNIDMVVSGAGSGSGLVSVTLPTNPDRNQRQALTLHTETIGAAGNASGHIGGGEAMWFPGGTGAASDRLRIDEGATTARENNVQGVDLLVNGHLTIQGWYLEA